MNYRQICNIGNLEKTSLICWLSLPRFFLKIERIVEIWSCAKPSRSFCSGSGLVRNSLSISLESISFLFNTWKWYFQLVSLVWLFGNHVPSKFQFVVFSEMMVDIQIASHWEFFNLIVKFSARYHNDQGLQCHQKKFSRSSFMTNQSRNRFWIGAKTLDKIIYEKEVEYIKGKKKTIYLLLISIWFFFCLLITIYFYYLINSFSTYWTLMIDSITTITTKT